MKAKSAIAAPDLHAHPGARASLVSSRQTMSVVAIEDFDALEDYVQAWEDLAASAVEPNPFYEPWMLMPALRAFTTGKNVRVALVLDLTHDAPVLCGVFPLERKIRYKKLPVAAYGLWQHIYCALCTPLIRAGRERECLNTLLDWLASERDSALIEFNQVSGDGPVRRLLDDCLSERKAHALISESHTRAMFRPAESADQYVRSALRRDHRKDLRRKTRRLSERGNLAFEALAPGGDLDRWTGEFLDLEASGWKTRDGGAFACSEVNRNYFVAIAKAAFEKGRLMMLALRLDGKPVAMKCNLLSEPGSFAFKIAFDESYAAYSPGVILELENIRLLHAEQRVKWMDSCAAPDHPMIDRLWPGRRPIHSLLVPTGGMAGGLVVSALPVLRSLKRKLRGLPVPPRQEIAR